jgi:hypothetical protein
VTQNLGGGLRITTGNNTGQTVFSLRETYKDGPRMVRGQSQLARELMAELLRRGYVRVHGRGYELRPDDV